MITRNETKTTHVGNVEISGRNPVVIQSMTKTHTTDIEACLRQISELVEAGCQLVRIAVPTSNDTAAFAKIVEQSPIPLIADIHFSSARAIESIEAGAAKIRLNPGNIKEKSDIIRIIDAAKSHGTAIRIGVNEASIRDLKQQNIGEEKRVALMIREMEQYVAIFEQRYFENLVLSAKSSNCMRTIEVNRELAENFDYPLHLGLTHAGLPEDAMIPSAVAIGTLLAEGIGDTLRVSIAGDPVQEVHIAKAILDALELLETKRGGVELIVCPTCGRCELDVVAMARSVKQAVADIDKPLRLAVMGCIVNGPGEAADADLAICAAKGKGYLYQHGERIAVVPEKELLKTMLAKIEEL